MTTQDTNHSLQLIAAALNRKDPVTAHRVFQSLPKAAAKSAMGLYLLAGILRLQGDGKGAERRYRQSLSQQSQPQVWHSLGVFLSEQRRWDEADDALRQAVAMAPTYLEAWVNIGRNNLKRHNYADALEAFEKADALKPTASAAMGKAQIHLAEGRHEEAVRCGQAAVGLLPADPRPYRILASAHAASASWKEAAATLETAPSTAHRDPELIREQAHFEYRDGAAERAIETLAAGLKVYPQADGLRQDLAKIKYTAGDPSYLTPFYDGLKGRPEDPNLLSLFAGFAALAGAPDEAVSVVESAIDRGVNDPSFLAAAAYLQRQAGSLSEAVETAERAHGAMKTGDRPDVLGTYAALTLESGCPDKALSAAERMVRRDPRDQLGLAYRATALAMMGDPAAEALLDFDSFTERREIACPKGYQNLAAFNEALAHDLLALHQTVREPIDQSLRGGTQVELSGMQHKYETIRLLVEALKDNVRAFAQRLPREAGHPFLGAIPDRVDLSGIWSVRLKNGGRHVAHAHPEGWLSSAYYVKLPKAVRDSADHQGWLRLGEPPFAASGGQFLTRDVEPKEGNLILFPSYVWHGTIPFVEETPRMTVAFDVRPGV